MSLENVISILLEEFKEIEKRVSHPEEFSDSSEYVELTKKYTRMKEVAEVFEKYSTVVGRISEYEDAISKNEDPEMVALLKEELPELESKKIALHQVLILKIVPPIAEDSRNAIMEIRAGTGGDEAALFAAELLRMYTKFAEMNKWKTEVLSFSDTGMGGIKDAVVKISGKNTFSFLKYESGVHRVQRVPATESQGRLHTSAVTVAVLPEAKDVDVKINNEDLKIDVFRSSGPGGQSVNTTDSAVRVTHVPSGIVVTCQDEKSQIQNKAKAMIILRTKLYEEEQRKLAAERDSLRRSMIGSGDRSEKIRTYNFPQNRITDHRIKLTLYKLDMFLGGYIEDMIAALRFEDNLKKLEKMVKNG
ncbi:peptide chain release factor 1 [bacterium]|nr:peptide chain release factor 1 [bacterium]